MQCTIRKDIGKKTKFCEPAEQFGWTGSSNTPLRRGLTQNLGNSFKWS